MRLLTSITGIVLAVSGCQSRYVDTYCAAAWPITYSSEDDTEETKRQIKQHNAVYEMLCRD